MLVGLQVFHGVVHEGALLPTLLCSLQRYYPNIIPSFEMAESARRGAGFPWGGA
jgi:hypothetical protein